MINMNWEDIIKNEFGYWRDEKTGKPVRNFKYGDEQAFSYLRDLVKEMVNSINRGEIGKYLDEMEANLMSEKVREELEYFEIYGAVEELYEHLNKVEDSIKEVHSLFEQQTDEI